VGPSCRASWARTLGTCRSRGRHRSSTRLRFYRVLFWYRGVASLLNDKTCAECQIAPNRISRRTGNVEKRRGSMSAQTASGISHAFDCLMAVRYLSRCPKVQAVIEIDDMRGKLGKVAVEKLKHERRVGSLFTRLTSQTLVSSIISRASQLSRP
jgi:hypothetical protein